MQHHTLCYVTTGLVCLALLRKTQTLFTILVDDAYTSWLCYITNTTFSFQPVYLFVLYDPLAYNCPDMFGGEYSPRRE